MPRDAYSDVIKNLSRCIASYDDPIDLSDPSNIIYAALISVTSQIVTLAKPIQFAKLLEVQIIF